VSTFVDVEVQCQACGLAEQRSVATSINASRTPAYREAILDGTFQRFTCAACSAEVAPLLPFVYLDFRRGQFIGVYPPDLESVWWQYEDEALEAYDTNVGRHAPGPARQLIDPMEVRAVFGLDALREKIRLLDARVDDAVVEALKLRLLLTHDPEIALRPRPRVVEVRQDDLVLRVWQDWGDGLVASPLVVSRIEGVDLAADESVRDLLTSLAAGPYRDALRVLQPAPLITRRG
jgi:hypothetical protein